MDLAIQEICVGFEVFTVLGEVDKDRYAGAG